MLPKSTFVNTHWWPLISTIIKNMDLGRNRLLQNDEIPTSPTSPTSPTLLAVSGLCGLGGGFSPTSPTSPTSLATPPNPSEYDQHKNKTWIWTDFNFWEICSSTTVIATNTKQGGVLTRRCVDRNLNAWLYSGVSCLIIASVLPHYCLTIASFQR